MGERPSLSLKVDLCPQFHQPSAHNLEYVPPRVIRGSGVARLLVQDGVVVENVIDIEIRLNLARIGQPEEPAETEVELFDALSVECANGTDS